MARPREISDAVIGVAYARTQAGEPLSRIAADVGFSARGLQQAMQRYPELSEPAHAPEPATRVVSINLPGGIRITVETG